MTAVESGFPRLRFWGVRGSVPTPRASHLRHGGNTPCVEVGISPAHRLILDAGTGIRGLGADLVAADPEELVHHIVLSHFHWDHIQGIPYFAPLLDPRHEIVIHAAVPPEEIRAALARQMASPYFPVDLGDVPARVRYEELPAGGVEIAGARVRPVELRHPQGANGCRIDIDGVSVVYAPDHEAGDPEVDAGLREAAADAGLLVHDAQYTPREYEKRRGWGHSSWEHATELAEAAGVGGLSLFHHDPDHDDEMLMAIERAARHRVAATRMAREGQVLELDASAAGRDEEGAIDRPGRRRRG